VTTWVALLRGVNVGGRRKVPMADLRDACTALGFENVSTYIQSGNVSFEHASPSGAAERHDLARTISQCVATTFGHSDVPVVMRTREEMAAIVQASPYAPCPDGKTAVGNSPDPKQLAVAFLHDEPVSAKRDSLDPSTHLPDTFAWAPSGTDIYLHCPSSFASTKLTTTWFEKALGVGATIRNWKTTTYLARLQ
jgi:uncharacterized protein (DUF1697 family)